MIDKDKFPLMAYLEALGRASVQACAYFPDGFPHSLTIQCSTNQAAVAARYRLASESRKYQKQIGRGADAQYLDTSGSPVFFYGLRIEIEGPRFP